MLTGETISWKIDIQNVFDEMIKEKELPERSLHIATNYGRDGKRITSYSLCIYEPDYPVIPSKTSEDPSRNSVILNIKESSENLEFIINATQFGDVGQPDGSIVKTLKSDKTNVHVLVPIGSKTIVDFVRKNTEYALANYQSKAATFGCCSSFEECSAAGKCVHENKLYSMACMYRHHLDAGEIFYGKNRNINQ